MRSRSLSSRSSGRALRRGLFVVACSTGAGAAIATAHHHAHKQQDLKLRLPRPVVDGIAGAVGEVAQVCILYPLETIKVRCQADGVTAGHVVRSMLAKHGVGWALLQQLYSGFGAAAAFSMAVGAVHWWAFCSAKRAALAALPSSPARAQPAPAAAAPVAVATSRGPADAGERDALMPFSEDGMPFEFAGAAGGGAAAVQQQVPQVALASVALAGGAMTVVEGGPAAASQRQQQRKKQQREREQQQQQGGEGGASAAEGGRELPQQQQQPQHEGGGGDMANRTSANLIAAGVGALCTALVEAPVELFRHQAQAGLISGNLVAEMGRAVRQGGPLALWHGFLPFCIEAFPYDAVELGSFSQLRDVYDAALTHSPAGSKLHALVRAVPEHACDAAMGAVAGAAAVLLSMPLDAIKTYLQTHDIGARSAGKSQLGLFWATGYRMVRRRGLGALYCGMTPRLAQQVPSSTICWWAVQQTQKVLEPFTVEDGGRPAAAH